MFSVQSKKTQFRPNSRAATIRQNQQKRVSSTAAQTSHVLYPNLQFPVTVVWGAEHHAS